MRRARPERLLKPKLLAVSVAACFALNAGPLRANPAGPTVMSGSVGFSGLGTSALTITNQAGGNAIINWNGFSIGVNELTKFQQFSNLAVLNRVTGSQLSSILGSLQSDGRVFLINPNGIVFGAGARIDTAGLVASSLGLSDRDFLANRLRFTEVPGAGAVVNNGVIETSAGGRVYLVAPTVENNGLIQSPQGAIVLAAGKEVELVDAASPFVTVKVAAAEQAVNVGDLVADGGQIGMFGALVRNSGVVSAGGAVAGPGGEIRLVATKDLTLDSGSVASASGTSGGKVLLQAESGTNLVGGTVEAKGNSGRGGEVSALGVRVGVVGHGVIDASGDSGGGTVLVGGDYQGGNAAVQNAERTYIGSDGVIRADAMTTGNGGRVIAWADGDTRFYGSISAKGGSAGGNGGFVETSGKGALQAFGSVNVAAPNGQGGTWLLDPTNIAVSPSAGLPDNGSIEFDGLLAFTDFPGTNTTVGANSIEAALAYGSAYGGFSTVQLQATNDITFNGNISIATPGALTLQAGNDIRFNSFSLTTHGNLSLQAAAYGGTPVTGAITSVPGGGNITTNNGDFSATGWSVILGNINTDGSGTGGGTVNLNASAGDIKAGSITTDGGYVDMNAIAGNVVVGAINTSGDALGGASNGDVYVDAYGNITTQSITTRGLHPDNGDGGNVGLFTQVGAISVNGNIDTRGANGLDDGSCCSAQYYGGTNAGDVTMGRTTLDGFAGNAIAVYGSIIAAGGNALTVFSEFSSPDQNGGDGGYVSFGGNCDGPCIYGPLDGNVAVTGTIDVSGGMGGSAMNDDLFAGTFGGAGGTVAVLINGNASVGSILARGGNAGSGGSGYNGNYGGDGGSITLSSNTGQVGVGAIDASGGAGGAGGVGGFSDANGGAGGAGGSIDINAYGAVMTGTVATRGGNAASGGNATSLGYGAVGGIGGDGGYVDISSYGGVSMASVNTSGGAGGNGGSTYGGDAGGGHGGAGSWFDARGTSVAVGPIATVGGSGGSGGTGSGNNQAGGGFGGDGGSVWLYATGGAVGVTSINTAGGGGGSGGLADNIRGATSASGGDGGEAGYVDASASTTLGVGTIYARGGAGGNGGSALGGDPLANLFTAARGGDGGGGYAVYLDATGAVTTGAIDASGAKGGAGGTSMDAAGGDGGYSAYSVSLYGASITTGAILARGGNGGTGGIAQTAAGDSSGGSGGGTGSVYFQTGGVSDGPITSGVVDASGGNGGNSGSIGTTTTVGGSGGSGGNVSYYGSAVTIAGPVFARGGNGGNMVDSSILSSSVGTPDGGSGGRGGYANITGTEKVLINVGGTLGALAIDVRGGAGGSGHPAASPAGNGGAGGNGGFADVIGTPDMTLFGSVNAGGGAGGAGGAGNAINIGGIGGAGGSAGGIFLDASSVTGSQTGDGIIFVLAGTQFNVQGGLGGFGGGDGGVGAGSAGLSGSTGTFNPLSDYFGTIIVLDPLSVPEINEGFQQIVKGADDSSIFVGGEKKEEEEDESQKELGSCKG